MAAESQSNRDTANLTSPRWASARADLPHAAPTTAEQLNNTARMSKPARYK